MGLGDFLEGAAKGAWHGYEHVSDAAWNLAKPVVDSTVYWGKNTSPIYNLATGNKGSETIVNDATSLGKGAYTGGKFVVQHPKESAQIAKTVGWEIAKDQVLNPENLAINTAMLATTVASGGTTAPAWMARLGITTKGLEAARGIEVGTDIAKGAEVGVDTAAAATRAADAATATARAAEFANPALNASRLERFSTANQATYAGFQDARGFGKIDAALDAPRQYMMNAKELVGMSREGAIQGARTGLANKLFPSVAEGEATGMGGALAKYGYRTVAGGAGMADVGARDVLSDMTWRYGTAAKRANQVTNFSSNVRTADQIAHGIGDPEWAARQLLQKGAKKGVQEAKAHKGDIIKFAEKHAGDQIVSTVRNKIFGDPANKKTPENSPEEAAPDVLSGMTVAPWTRPDTGLVTTRSAQRSAPRQVTTTVSAAPDHIGPSSWYDQQESTSGFAGQPGYASGRGFRATSSWSQDPAAVA